MNVPEEAFPFRSSTGEGIPFYGLLPLLGVCFIIAGLFLRRDAEKRLKASSSSPHEIEKCLQRILLSVTVAFMIVQLSIVPGIAWFLMTGSTDWVAILSAASVIVFVRDFPGKSLLEVTL